MAYEIRDEDVRWLKSDLAEMEAMYKDSGRFDYFDADDIAIKVARWVAYDVLGMTEDEMASLESERVARED